MALPEFTNTSSSPEDMVRLRERVSALQREVIQMMGIKNTLTSLVSTLKERNKFLEKQSTEVKRDRFKFKAENLEEKREGIKSPKTNRPEPVNVNSGGMKLLGAIALMIGGAGKVIVDNLRKGPDPKRAATMEQLVTSMMGGAADDLADTNISIEQSELKRIRNNIRNNYEQKQRQSRYEKMREALKSDSRADVTADPMPDPVLDVSLQSTEQKKANAFIQERKEAAEFMAGRRKQTIKAVENPEFFAFGDEQIELEEMGGSPFLSSSDYRVVEYPMFQATSGSFKFKKSTAVQAIGNKNRYLIFKEQKKKLDDITNNITKMLDKKVEKRGAGTSGSTRFYNVLNFLAGLGTSVASAHKYKSRKQKNRVNPITLYNYLVNVHKVSPIHAAGMVLNVDRESTFDPASDNGYAVGLFQHEGPRKTAFMDFFQKRKTNWKEDWHGQVDFLMQETNKNNYEQTMRNRYFSRDYEHLLDQGMVDGEYVSGAADDFMRLVIRPRDKSLSLLRHEQRLQSGKSIYQRMVPSAITGVVGGAGVTIIKGSNINQQNKQSNMLINKKVVRGPLVTGRSVVGGSYLDWITNSLLSLGSH